MEIRAAEISDIIKKQIEEYEREVEVRETGRVLSTGDGIARSERPLNRGSSPPSGQQGGMQVQATQGGNVAQRLGQDLPVGHNDHEVRRHRVDKFMGFQRTRRLRLPHRNPQLLGDDFDRCRLELEVAPLGSIRLTQHADDLAWEGGGEV